jgi:hypothetical protein
MKNKMIAFLTLFTSMSTLICCALPAFFVTLGMGAAFAGLVTKVPQLIWISEHHLLVFGVGGILLIFGGLMQWQARKLACPVDPKLAAACKETRSWSPIIYFVSVGIYLVGAFFAFSGPILSSLSQN